MSHGDRDVQPVLLRDHGLRYLLLDGEASRLQFILLFVEFDGGMLESKVTSL